MIPEHNVRIHDMNMETNLIEVLNHFSPDFVGISITTPLIKEAKETISIIRKNSPDSKIIIGGPYISIFHDRNIDCDYAVVGEGEYSIRKIINEKLNEKLIFSEKIKNLDDLPYPRREFNHNRYAGIDMFLSRSCPYQCIYCASKAIFGNKMSFRGTENIIGELKEIKQKYGRIRVFFLDDCFTLIRSRIIEICERIIEENLEMNYWIDTRCDKVDEELLMLMKKAGFDFIVFGVESGNQNVLNRIRKNLKLEDIRKAFSLVNKLGIDSKCNMMMGHLDETEEEILDTINLAKELKATKSSFYKVIPLPGSELYDICIQRGLIKGDDSEFETMAWYKYPPVISKVSEERLEELQKFSISRNYE